MTLTQLDQQYVANTYKRFDVELSHGKGSEIFSFDGKRYIDMGSGIGVTCFGIADDKWQEAVISQLGALQHTSNLYYTSPCARLAQLLCQRTGMKKVFFANSGAEANECAIKLARKYASDVKNLSEAYIITLKNSFHGRTLTTLAATGQDHFHKLFQPLTPGFIHAEANDIEGVKKLCREYPVAAILFECIQGEGGVIELNEEFVKGLDELCKKNDILLMVDEVQTGNGRTGKLYAYQNFGITPDVVTTAKGLGGGLPIGAFICSEKCSSVLGRSHHGTTFGANPVSNAGAVAVLERLTPEFLEDVERKGEHIRKTVASWNLPCVKDIRGKGLMIGIEIEGDPHAVGTKCFEHGLLILSAGKNVVRMLPPLTISYAEIEAGLLILKSCME